MMKKDLKLIEKQRIPGCAIVTRVENNQREKVFINKFLPRISNHPGKYGIPWQYAKMSCNRSHFENQVWHDPGTYQGKLNQVYCKRCRKKNLKWHKDKLLRGEFNMDNKGMKQLRANTMTQKLLTTVGENRLEELWVKYGMYKSAELLSMEMQEYVSFSTMRYLSHIKNWKRPINKLSPLYRGYLAGNVDPSKYKHLIFPEEITKNETIKQR